jgi:hypothetical protein
MNQRVGQSEVDRLRAALEQAPERAAKVSRGQALRMLALQLRALRGRGYTVDDIVELLRGNGWAVGADTVRACLAGKRRNRPRIASNAPAHDQRGRPEGGKTKAVSGGSEGETMEPGPSKMPSKTEGPPVHLPRAGAAKERTRLGAAEANDQARNPPKSTFGLREDSDEI